MQLDANATAAAANVLYYAITYPVNPPGTPINLTSHQVWTALHAKTLHTDLFFPVIVAFNITQLADNVYQRHSVLADGQTVDETIYEYPPYSVNSIIAGGVQNQNFVSASADEDPFGVYMTDYSITPVAEGQSISAVEKDLAPVSVFSSDP